MITKWRSPDWQNPYGKPRMGKKASRWYELGADAMLQSLRAVGEIVMDAETGINGLNVVIPDDPLDPQPVSNPDEFKKQRYICPIARECPPEKLEKYSHCFARLPHDEKLNPGDSTCPKCVKVSTPEKPDNSKEQLMICKRHESCKGSFGTCFNATPHIHTSLCDVKGVCDVCVPYIEPEKEIPFDYRVGLKMAREVQKNRWWHTATKTIEEGYLCKHCFRTISKGNYCGCYFSLEELK